MACSENLGWHSQKTCSVTLFLIISPAFFMEISDIDNFLEKLAQIIWNYVFIILPWFIQKMVFRIYFMTKINFTFPTFEYWFTTGVLSQVLYHLPGFRYLPKRTKLSKLRFQNLSRIFSKKSLLSAISSAIYLTMPSDAKLNINRNLTFKSPKTISFLFTLEYLNKTGVYTWLIHMITWRQKWLESNNQIFPR